MTLFSDPWILDSLGILLTAVGSAGLVALFIASPLRPVMKRAVAVICPAMAIGGVLLMVRAEALRNADRDLDPAQQATLAKAIGQFPNVKFEVFTAHDDNETQSLAAKVVDAVKAGTGAAPAVGKAPLPSPSSTLPLPFKGVVLVMHDREADLGRAVAATIGRALMAARVAVITDDDAKLDNRTVRIVVAEKP
jgi:hypothetical protein